jgi:hypothetical protein
MQTGFNETLQVLPKAQEFVKTVNPSKPLPRRIGFWLAVLIALFTVDSKDTLTDDGSGDVLVVPLDPNDAGSGLDPRFRYCTHAIAAGFGPYVAGIDPEYAWYNDRDGDGIVCER